MLLSIAEFPSSSNSFSDTGWRVSDCSGTSRSRFYGVWLSITSMNLEYFFISIQIMLKAQEKLIAMPGKFWGNFDYLFWPAFVEANHLSSYIVKSYVLLQFLVNLKEKSRYSFICWIWCRLYCWLIMKAILYCW